jgi:hypothetical protein
MDHRREGGRCMNTADVLAARANAHRANIKRYCGLLAMDLTERERAYLHKRIAEEQAALEQLTRDPVSPLAQAS